MANRKSSVWKYFIDKCADSVQCSLCNKSYSNKGRGTTSLKNHLRSMHKKEYNELNEVIEGEELKKVIKGNPKQSAVKEIKSDIKEFFKSTKQWDSSDFRSKTIDKRIGEMIVVDDLPFSHVEDLGFMRLVAEIIPQYKLKKRNFYTSLICDDIYKSVFCKIKNIIHEIKKNNKFAFTTDVWSDTSAGVSLLSLTLHTINRKFQRINLVLGAIPLEERHTGEYISRKFDEMLNKWDIERTNIHCVMRDSGANMKKALFLSGVNNLDCAIHKMQLIVKSGIDSEQEIIEVIRKCRAIAAHFNHSTMAQDELNKIQERFQKPKLNVVHDTPTRWNSTLYMLRRTEELKEALCLYAASQSKIPFISNLEWKLLSGSIKLLEPYEEFTKKLSISTSTIGDVIPLVASLRKALENVAFLDLSKEVSEDSSSIIEHYEKGNQIINGMKHTMRIELDKRFKGLENEDIYRIATYLDPRYKGKFFSSAQIEQIKMSIIRLCNNINVKNVSEPERKRKRDTSPKPCCSKSSSLSEAMSIILGSSSDDEEEYIVKESTLEVLEKYNKEKRQKQDEDVLKWWNEKSNNYPDLSKVACMYLSCPPSSVPSEQLFSGAGHIYDDRRKRLHGDKAEKLLFLKHNLPGIKFDY